MTVFAKGATSPAQLSALSQSGYQTVGLDWTVSPRFARTHTQSLVALQGNVDPSVLLGGRDAIKAEVRRVAWGPDGFLTCAAEGTEGGWIVNLGHGITPGVDPEDARYFLERVRRECEKKSVDDEPVRSRSLSFCFLGGGRALGRRAARGRRSARRPGRTAPGTEQSSELTSPSRRAQDA